MEDTYTNNNELNGAKSNSEKAKAELAILYQISNAMHTTLKLDEILYIILTGATAHIGLGFNRAMLLLINDSLGQLEGKMGIGPDTAEAADSIWRTIKSEELDLENLINSYSREKLMRSKFNSFVESLSFPCDSKSGDILSTSLNSKTCVHIAKEKILNLKNDPLLKVFHSNDFAIAPLKAKDKSIGLIVADNFVTLKAITNDDVRMLTMFANQAGLAIENSRLYEQTLIRSHTDALTGLWNHGYFQQKLGQMLESAKISNQYLSLIMIDIDDFKIFNDTWGHQRGDDILVQMSKIFKEASRKLDYICRYGGEEFAIILPQINPKDALVIAGRIHSAVNKYNFDSGSTHPPQRITLSLGVATFPNHGHNKSELIQAADKALYQAKDAGKNRVVGFSSF